MSNFVNIKYLSVVFMRTQLFYLFFSLTFCTVFAQKKIIKTGDEWEFYDEAISPGKNWNKSLGPAENWKIGPSPLGYGNNSIATNISFGDDPNNKHITKYFKKTFRIEDPYDHLVYKLEILRDDGIVLYLNGHEILRNNMPSGEITNDTKANSLVLSKRMENILFTKLLFPDDFNPGINTFSVSVHQGRVTSSDCLFDLELVGDDDPEKIPLLLREQTIKSLNLDLRIQDLNHKQEIEKNNQHINFVTKTNKTLTVGVYVVGILFVITLIGIVYLLWYYRKKSKTFDKKMQSLVGDVNDKDRRLISYSLNIVQNQQFLNDLKQDLADVVNEGETTNTKELKKTIRKIDYNLNQDEEWLNLMNHFNTVHNEFSDKLLKLHPSLTDIEQRHCVFIKLQMQTKEIAQILHIDPRSVQAARYRIKKKMDLGEGIDLRDYILKF